MTILFILYVELSVGNIVYRETASGIKTFQLGNIFHYLIHPLLNRFLWNLELLDVNYIFVISLSTFIFYSN